MTTKDIDKINLEISKIIDNNFLIIVEGKKDIASLNNLGIKNIISLENKPLFKIIESINEKEVIILTDLDKEGKKLFNKLRYNLQKNRIKINIKLRNLLFKNKLSHIEGPDTYLKQQ